MILRRVEDVFDISQHLTIVKLWALNKKRVSN